MFGVYRTLLALMVVSQHLAGAHVLGAYAVFGFYILSGYLMTLIMHRNYGYGLIGIYTYGVNRFLRIYPMYWISISFSFLLILWLGSQFSVSYHESMFLPENYLQFLKNIFIYFPSIESPRLTPPSWALTVELFFYILIGLGVSKNKKIVLVWLCVSVIYHVIAQISHLGWENIYFPISAASLPFATGASIFLFRDEILNIFSSVSMKVKKILPIITFLCILLNWYVGDITGNSKDISFYINFIFCSAMVLLLSKLDDIFVINKKIDESIGDLSFPIYVIHYQVGMLIVAFLNHMGWEYQRPDVVILLLSLPVILIIAWFLARYVERPIETLRSRIRLSRSSLNYS